MKFTIPHQYQNKEGAIAQVKAMLNQHRAEFEKHASDITESWEGDVLSFGFTAQGTHITGTLAARDSEFDISAKLPLMMRMFEGRIEKMIKEQIAQAVQK